MSKQTWIAVLALVSVAAVYVLFIRKTDEDRIRGKLRALCESVHQGEGDNVLLRAARIEREFPKLFTQEVDLHVPDLYEGRRPRKDLSTRAAGASVKATSIDLRFSNIHVEVDRPAKRSWVMADATVSGALKDGGRYLESRNLALRFDIEEEEWKIADIALQGAGAQ